jgi:hypothetical protein
MGTPNPYDTTEFKHFLSRLIKSFDNQVKVSFGGKRLDSTALMDEIVNVAKQYYNQVDKNKPYWIKWSTDNDSFTINFEYTPPELPKKETKINSNTV